MKASTPGHAFGVTFVDELARCGVLHAVVAPGSRSTPLALALAGDDRLTTHVCLDERSASFLALGMAKATGVPSVLLSTSGTAPANFHPAVLEADAARVPLIVISADRPVELRATGATQTVDQIKLFGDAVRWFCEVGVPETLPTSVAYWRSLADRAVAMAADGPVHLNIAFRDPLVPTQEVFPFDLDGRPDGTPWTSYDIGRRVLDGSQLEGLTREVARVERGIIVAGPGPYESESVTALAEHLGWPLLADPLSGARHGSSAVATYDSLLRSESFCAAREPDLVLRFGSLGTSKPLLAFLESAGRRILIDPDGAALDPARNTERIIGADVEDSCGRLVEALEPRTSSSWLADWQQADTTARAALAEILDSDNAISEPRLARDLVAALPDGANLVVAASMSVRDVEAFTVPRTGVRFHANRGANGIDGFVSTALGIAVASSQPTFALLGDLCFLHDRNALLAGSVRDADLTLVVVNNDGGGIFSFLPQAEDDAHFERLFTTPHGLDLAKIAASHDLEHRLLTSADELGAALASGVWIIEARTDRTANVALHRRLNEAVAAAL